VGAGGREWLPAEPAAHVVGEGRQADPGSPPVDDADVDGGGEDGVSVDDRVAGGEDRVDRWLARDPRDAVDDVGEVAWVGLPAVDGGGEQRDAAPTEGVVVRGPDGGDGRSGVLEDRPRGVGAVLADEASTRPAVGGDDVGA